MTSDRRRPAALAALAAVVAAGVCVPAGHAAAADVTPVELPPGTVVSTLTTVRDIAVNAHHVFLAEGAGGSRIAVMAHDGEHVATIGNIPGPAALAVQGTTLYVTAMGASSIYVYDVSALPASLVDIHSTLPIEAPSSLARAGGRLWYTGMDENNSLAYASLGSMTTAGEDVASFFPPSFQYWQLSPGCGEIDHSPFAPTRILVHSQICSSADAVYLYDASTEPPDPLGVYGTGDDFGDYTGAPVTVLPDGSGMLVPSGTRDAIDVRALDTLNGPVDRYLPPAGWDVVGSAIASGGTASIASPGVKGEFFGGAHGLLVWEQQTRDAVNAFVFDPREGRVVRTLAFDATASRLFAATTSEERIAFHVIDPTLRGTALDLVVSDRLVEYGEQVRLRATLAPSVGGRTVSVEGTTAAGTTLVGTCTTDADGRCSITATPSRRSIYQASFEGVDGWASSTSVSRQVRVAVVIRGEMRRFYQRSGSYALFHDDERADYAVEVDPPRPRGLVGLLVERNEGNGWYGYVEDRVRLNDRGRAIASFAPAAFNVARYRVHGTYVGDDAYDRNTSSWAYFRITR